MTITLISIFNLSFSPLIPSVKCIGWNYDGSNFVEFNTMENLDKLTFENGDAIPDVLSYFMKLY
jgi:hypothetical protein